MTVAIPILLIIGFSIFWWSCPLLYLSHYSIVTFRSCHCPKFQLIHNFSLCTTPRFSSLFYYLNFNNSSTLFILKSPIYLSHYLFSVLPCVSRWPFFSPSPASIPWLIILCTCLNIFFTPLPIFSILKIHLTKIKILVNPTLCQLWTSTNARKGGCLKVLNYADGSSVKFMTNSAGWALNAITTIMKYLLGLFISQSFRNSFTLCSSSNHQYQLHQS